MFEVAIIIILLAMLFALVAAIVGKTVYDKILATNIFGTITILFIAVFSFLIDRTDFLDIALMYALINFVATIAILKFVECGDIGKGSQHHHDIKVNE